MTLNTATPGTLNDVWCDECGGYLACDLAPQVAQRYADHHSVKHDHAVWIDAA